MSWRYCAVEIEVVMLGPGALDDVEPFLGEIVAGVVLALGDAEHLELALVPADDEIDAEASLPMWSAVTNSLAAISGWNSGAWTVPKTVMRSVAPKRPAAQVTVSSVEPWKSVSPP